MTITDRLTEGVRTALAQAGLPPVDDCVWEVPRQTEHGDYAANVAMLEGDYAPERLRNMRRANLDALSAERRILQYRDLRLRVDARSKDDVTINGVFGSEVVSVSEGSTMPPTSPTSKSDA